MYEQLLHNISKHISLTEEETAYFISLVKSVDVSKKSILLEEGRTCKYIYFVNTGTLRAYCTDKEEKESTIMFAVSDWWITDMYCFINDRPAMLTIEAVENSNICQLSKIDLDQLFTTIPKFEKFFRILMQNAYVREQLRVIQNLTLPAEERYHQFLSKYPQVVSQVTLKQIASYLGITPEFLSAIRARR